MEQTAEVVETVAQTAVVPQQPGSWGMVLYMVVVIAIFYFVMVRPNKKRMAEYQKMLSSLSKNQIEIDILSASKDLSSCSSKLGGLPACPSDFV